MMKLKTNRNFLLILRAPEGYTDKKYGISLTHKSSKSEEAFYFHGQANATP